MKKALLIVNPVSGTRSKRSLPDLLAAELCPLGYDLDIVETSASGDARNFAAEAVSLGSDLVIAAGGDGTVNETATSLMHTETPLAIIPCGSGNGFARSLGIPQDFDGAVKVIREGNIMKCDSGVVNGRTFFCTCGVGFDAEVSERFATEKRRGRMSYIKDAFLDYVRYKPKAYAISINGEIITKEAFLIAVCNASQYGNNAYIAPQASLTDGLLDVTVVHSGSLLNAAIAGIDLFTGYLDRNTLIDTFRVKEVRIARLEDGASHVDGEPAGLGKVLDISCDPGSLNVVFKRGAENFKPIITPLKSMVGDVASDIKNAFKN